MTTLLAHESGVPRLVEDDRWHVVDGELPEDGAADVLVPLEQLDAARGRAGRLGVRVPGDADDEALGPRLEGVDLVAVEIPKFTDGRAYSLARLLRDKHGFRGELRATGAVLRDQLFYLARCGFDSFALAEGVRVEDALAAFEDFSGSYQPGADHDEPIWRRRRSNS
jgi:uncharacterized protein (DUF934 family)